MATASGLWAEDNDEADATAIEQNVDVDDDEDGADDDATDDRPLAATAGGS